MFDEKQKSEPGSLVKDHLANERTFLAWVRTSIGIMAFGFVIEKFAFFIKQFALLPGKSDLYIPAHSAQGYSSVFGVFLVAFGVLLCLLAFVRYKKVETQIDDNTYRPSLLLNVVLTAFVLLTGIFLVIYLNNSI